MKQVDALKEKLRPITDKLKPLAQKAKPYTDKIGSYFQRFSPEALKYIIWAVIAVVSFSFGLIIGCELRKRIVH